MIAFNQIPIDLNTPGVYVEEDTSRANTGLPLPRTRAVIIGQRLQAGVATSFKLYRVNNEQEAVLLFGYRSQITRMIRAYRLNNEQTELWAIGLPDPAGGVATVWTITLTGTASRAGALKVQLAGHDVRAQVPAGATAAQTATALAAAMNAVNALPVTATAAGGVVTVTAAHLGAVSNEFKWSIDASEIVGIGNALAAVTSGAGTCNITDALVAIGDEPFSTIVHGLTDDANMDTLEAWLDNRNDGLRQLDTLAYACITTTLGDQLTYGYARNHPYAPVGGIPNLPNPSWELAPATAAQVDASATADPARPFNGLVLKGIIPPKEGERLGRAERGYLLGAGIATYVVNGAGNLCIDWMVTTYKGNAQGFADQSLSDLNDVLIWFYLRYSLRYRFTTKFPRHKLGSDGGNYAPGQPIVTPKSLRAELIALALEWESAGLIENVSQFKNDLVVERDSTNPNRVNAVVPPDFINRFKIMAAQIQFRR